MEEEDACRYAFYLVVLQSSFGNGVGAVVIVATVIYICTGLICNRLPDGV